MFKVRLSLLVGGALALAACSGAAEPDPEMAIMGEVRAELPDWFTAPEGFPVTDLTHMADVDHLKVLASRDDENNWCVVLVVEPGSTGPGGAVGASCVSAERFASEGVWVETSVGSTGRSGRRGAALLLPDDFSGEIGDDWERVNDNIAVRP